MAKNKRKIILSKSQKKQLDEINVMADTGSTGGNITLAVQNAQNAAKRQGINNPSVVIPPTNESFLTNKEEMLRKRMQMIKEAKSFTKDELISLIESLNARDFMNENFNDLKQLGIFELADAIVSAKNNFSDLVTQFCDNLHDNGYKFKDIVTIVNKLQLDGLIPKVMLNRLEAGYKQKELEEKELLKNKNKNNTSIKNKKAI